MYALQNSKPHGSLRKGLATKSDEFSENCQGGGGWSISIQKIMLHILGTLNKTFEHKIGTKYSNFRL